MFDFILLISLQPGVVGLIYFKLLDQKSKFKISMLTITPVLFKNIGIGKVKFLAKA